MAVERFPGLDLRAATRDALHAYARVIGAYAATGREKRKHWWHASLRPSLRGLATGVIFGPADFELELDFVNSQLHVRTLETASSEPLTGQPSAELASFVRDVLGPLGVDESVGPGEKHLSDATYPEYAANEAAAMHGAIASVAAAMGALRAGIREESSPIQVWPHHFDLSMIWLPGQKIRGQDPRDEEYSDKQMNFGFAFGDEGIPEPYFYVTAYPTPAALPSVELPEATTWRTDGFNGAVTLYKDVAAMQAPHDYLLGLWKGLLQAGQEHLAIDD